MKNTIITLFTLSMFQFCLGQGVGIGTSTPNASAAVEISSTTKGILVPRMTTAQRNLIVSPATGLLVFDLTSNSFWFRNTNSWVELVDSVKTEVHRSGIDKIYMGMADRVGVGTNNPAYKLQVKTGNEAYGISHTNGTVDIATFTGDTGGWIGTKSNHPFHLYSNDGFDQVTLLPSGNFGIGTSSPDQRLSVNNKFGVDNNGSIHVKNTARQFYFYEDGLPSKMILSHSPTYPTWGLQYLSTNQFRFLADSNALMTIDLNAFRVGIGVDNPSATLEIARSNAPNGTLQIKGSTYDSHFNYSTDEHTFIRGGKAGSNVNINDIPGLGNVIIGTKLGLGNVNPNGWLQFPNLLDNRKIVMWENGNNDHEYFGFGINGSTLRYQVSGVGDSHVFYAGTSSSASNELMRIRGNGNVDVAGSLEIGYIRVASDPVYISPLGDGSAQCNCPAGTKVIGGGYDSNSDAMSLYHSFPNSDTSWYVSGFNGYGFDSRWIRAWAICARLAN